MIEQGRKAGQDYIDSFHGDLDAMTADLNHRALIEKRVTVTLPLQNAAAMAANFDEFF